MAKKKDWHGGSLTAGRKTAQTALLALCAVACFFAVTLSSESTAKGAVIVLGTVLLVLLCFFWGKLRERMGLPMFLLAALVALQGIASLYAQSGRAALTEYMKILSPFLIVLLLALPGSGALLDDCKALAASLGVDRRVLFPGEIWDMGPWYAMADGAVTASRSMARRDCRECLFFMRY